MIRSVRRSACSLLSDESDGSNTRGRSEFFVIGLRGLSDSGARVDDSIIFGGSVVGLDESLRSLVRGGDDERINASSAGSFGNG